MTDLHPRFDVIKKNYESILDINIEVDLIRKNTFETLTGLKMSDEDYRKLLSAQLAISVSDISML